MTINTKFAKNVLNDIDKTSKRIEEKRKEFKQLKANGAMLSSHRFKLDKE